MGNKISEKYRHHENDSRIQLVENKLLKQSLSACSSNNIYSVNINKQTFAMKFT